MRWCSRRAGRRRAPPQPAAPRLPPPGLDYEMFKSRDPADVHQEARGAGAVHPVPRTRRGHWRAADHPARRGHDELDRGTVAEELRFGEPPRRSRQPRGQPAADAPAGTRRRRRPVPRRRQALGLQAGSGMAGAGAVGEHGAVDHHRGFGRFRGVPGQDRADLPARAGWPDGPRVVRRLSLGHRHAAEAAGAAGFREPGRSSSRGRTSRPHRS